jgi:AraC-like DNA-binding protein
MSADSAEPHVQTVRIHREFPAETAWHCHREAQLYSLTSGIMTVETKRGSIAMPAGGVGWIPALQEHRARTLGATVGWSTYFPPDLATRLPSEPCVLQNSELVEALVRRIATWPQECLRSEPYQRIVRVLIDELQSRPEESLRLPMPQDRRLVAVAGRLLAEPASRRSLPDWARWAGISPRSLARGFKIQTGLTFGRWRTLARMLRALEGLEAGASVGEIALRSGYENTSAFISTFRSHFGTTPAAYFAKR